MKCPKCNADISDSARFCPTCGAQVTAPPPQMPPQPQSPYPQYNDNGQDYRQNPYQNQNGQNRNTYQNNINVNAQNQAGGTGTAALVCGIISLFCFGLVLGIIAICLGASSYKRLSAQGLPAGKSIAGIALGVIGLVIWIIGIILYATVWAAVWQELLNKYY